MARVLLSAQHCLPTDVLSNVFGFAVLFQSLRSYDTAFGLRKALGLQQNDAKCQFCSGQSEE